MTDPLAFCAAFARDRAETVLVVPGGFAVRSPARFPSAWDHNFVQVEEPVPPEVLMTAVDDVFGDAPHRRVQVPAQLLTTALADALTAAGHQRSDLVVMTHTRAPDADRPAGDGVETLGIDERIAFATTTWHDGEMSTAVQAQLGDRARSAVAAADCTFLGVRGDDGAVQATCDLFVRGDTAQVEEVITLPEHRGRGLASRLVNAAVHRATVTAHASTVFLLAEADDWPRQLYTRLGFDVTDRLLQWDRAVAG